MSIQRSSALLLAPLSRTIARPTVLQCCTSRSRPWKSRRCLSRDGSSGTDISSPTQYVAAKEDASPSNKVGVKELDQSLPIVEYDTPMGRVRRNVKVSAKANVDKLTAALSPLLSFHTSSAKSTESAGSRAWHLDLPGSAINRFFAFDSEANANKFVDSVRTAADEMDHHPDIATSASRIQDTNAMRYVAISCSTHRPPGLSMRDVRLARKIDELAEPFNHTAINQDEPESFLEAMRRNLSCELQSQRGGK